jgi:hypothetical protein
MAAGNIQVDGRRGKGKRLAFRGQSYPTVVSHKNGSFNHTTVKISKLTSMSLY